MVKNFWGTRFFSNFFNEKAEKLSVSLGKSGDIASLLLFPVIGASVWVFYFICIFMVFPNVIEGASLLGLVYPLVCMLSVALPTFFVRVFAKKYSAKTFAMFMILPAFSFIIVACTDNTLHLSIAEDLNSPALSSWYALEAAALLIVLFYKPYSHYRAFQIVGSLFLFLCGAMVSFYSVSICYAVLVFWILSTAHILFRDKLLDYLEKK